MVFSLFLIIFFQLLKTFPVKSDGIYRKATIFISLNKSEKQSRWKILFICTCILSIRYSTDRPQFPVWWIRLWPTECVELLLPTMET